MDLPSNKNILNPFISYFGGKWRLARSMPAPTFNTIIEPFAGGAGYSLRHYQRNVILYEIDPVVAGVWDYLIHASPHDINSLPLQFDHIDEVVAPQEAKWLIGFWLNCGVSAPRNVPSKWVKEKQAAGKSACWGPIIRNRIAMQIVAIRHWKIHNKSFTDAPNEQATWFVDPPYCTAGVAKKGYKFHNIDFPFLAEWCRARQGQVLVCEQEGATWLPFQPFANLHATNGRFRQGVSKEMLWTK